VSRDLRIDHDVRGALEAVVRCGKSLQRDVLRASIVLLASAGRSDAEIARRLGCHSKTVRKWRGRFAVDACQQSLLDLRRSGRPATIPVSMRCELLAIACDRPDKRAFRKVWTAASLATALERRAGFSMSVTEVRRTLRDAELRPHRARMWLHSPDVDFRRKVRRICRLYKEAPTDGVVICVDEKTGMQALEHRFALRLATLHREGRREFEYVRHGTRALLAGFNPHTGEVLAQCRRRRTGADLLAFMEAIARAHPRGKIYIVWDNLNTHAPGRWVEFNRRHGNRFRFVYTPVHASWVNQIEIWFSILHRRVLKHGSFESAKQLVAEVMRFVAHWNREAHPFRWKFSGNFGARAAA
jgi:transposase